MRISKALMTAALLVSVTLPVVAEEAATTTLPSVTVIKAAASPISERLTATGSFAAGELYLVSPEVEGLAVREFFAEEGDTVKKDQVLVKLSQAGTKIQMTQLEANLVQNVASVNAAKNQIESARISLNKAGADLNRTKKLRRSGVATVEALDERQAAYDLALSQLESAELNLEVVKAQKAAIDAQMEELKLRLDRTEVKAPIDGYISRRTVQVGQIGSASREPMYNIVANGIVKLVAEVPESDLPRIKLGLKADITVNGRDKPIRGEVGLISPEVNEQTRIGLVHIRLEDGVRVPLGAFGRAEIQLAESDGLTLPLTAVTFGEDGPTVQVVDAGKIVVRKIITGLVSSETIEITGGITAGDMVVARAGTFVREGDAVTPVMSQ